MRLLKRIPIGSIGRVALVACGTAVSIPSAQAQDASFGCKVLLCAAASAPGWTAIPYCVPIMEEVFRELALGGSWPTCSQANDGRPDVSRFTAALRGY
ncbi:hypothetical protein RHAL1_P00096 (plasmid) [Beijerinckiaceae bacterium RH AL1]|nr:hypothetical protein RHAL1_P00096 [Beijerinckiaceae bacterium RH AL1]